MEGKSITNNEDVSDTVGENAAQSWTHRCDHTEGMLQKHLGHVSSPCRPVTSGRGCAATFLQSLERPCGWPFSRMPSSNSRLAILWRFSRRCDLVIYKKINSYILFAEALSG